jgi:hypothetical protein
MPRVMRTSTDLFSFTRRAPYARTARVSANARPEGRGTWQVRQGSEGLVPSPEHSWHIADPCPVVGRAPSPRHALHLTGSPRPPLLPDGACAWSFRTPMRRAAGLGVPVAFPAHDRL